MKESECVVYVGGLSLEDNGNYTCEISGPHNALLGFVTHRIFVRGRLVWYTYSTRSVFLSYNARHHIRIVTEKSMAVCIATMIVRLTRTFMYYSETAKILPKFSYFNSSFCLVLFPVTLIIGSKRIYCIYLGRHGEVFRLGLQLPQTRTCRDENWNISKGQRCALIQEKWEKSSQGFRLRVPKRVFSVFNATRPFGHLSCTDFDHF